MSDKNPQISNDENRAHALLTKSSKRSLSDVERGELDRIIKAKIAAMNGEVAG